MNTAVQFSLGILGKNGYTHPLDTTGGTTRCAPHKHHQEHKYPKQFGPEHIVSRSKACTGDNGTGGKECVAECPFGMNGIALNHIGIQQTRQIVGGSNPCVIDKQAQSQYDRANKHCTHIPAGLFIAVEFLRLATHEIDDLRKVDT